MFFPPSVDFPAGFCRAARGARLWLCCGQRGQGNIPEILHLRRIILQMRIPGLRKGKGSSVSPGVSSCSRLWFGPSQISISRLRNPVIFLDFSLLNRTRTKIVPSELVWVSLCHLSLPLGLCLISFPFLHCSQYFKHFTICLLWISSLIFSYFILFYFPHLHILGTRLRE